ncbi:MAG TPA: phenylalanyl--tRNA ligase subunit alpha, partial [Nitrospirota bacterium]|nr:phenylalanyl--tRNA ligase subunit alpha [Nitrospirota bacterium]
MAKGETREIIDSLHPLEVRLLLAFEAGKAIDDSLLISRASVEQAQKDMAIGWLLAKGIVEVTGETVERIVALTEIGERYRDQKTPELRIYQTIRDNPDVNMSGIREREDLDPTEISSATGSLKASGIIRIAQGGRLEIADPSPLSEFEDIQTLIVAVANRGEVNLSELSQGEQVIIEGLHRKRGKTKGVFRINEKVSRTYKLTDLGAQIHAEVLQRGKLADEISQLTPEMLKDGSWEGKSFRKYNITLPPPRVTPGRKHPYKEFLDSVKNKLVAMGFEEMRGGLVENEFWNMDALYMPQFHPAR